MRVLGPDSVWAACSSSAMRRWLTVFVLAEVMVDLDDWSDWVVEEATVFNSIWEVWSGAALIVRGSVSSELLLLLLSSVDDDGDANNSADDVDSLVVYVRRTWIRVVHG